RHVAAASSVADVDRVEEQRRGVVVAHELGLEAGKPIGPQPYHVDLALVVLEGRARPGPRKARVIRCGHGLAPQLSGGFQVLLAQPLGLAEDVVFRHVGRVATGGWMPAQRFGECANVMRPSAAAYSQIAHVERMGGLGELGDFETVAGERVERHGEWMIAWDAAAVPVVERLEGRLTGRGPVWPWRGRYVDALE